MSAKSFIKTVKGTRRGVSLAQKFHYRLGAVFMLTLGISLFLQIKDLTDMRDFMLEFRDSQRDYTHQLR